jgi:hypothetical protein
VDDPSYLPPVDDLTYLPPTSDPFFRSSSNQRFPFIQPGLLHPAVFLAGFFIGNRKTGKFKELIKLRKRLLGDEQQGNLRNS